MRRFGPTTPILGVCLGHQCIGEAYGGDIVRAGRPMHGKTSRIVHDGTGIFAGLPSPLRVARYHSLVIRPDSLPASLRVTARALDDGEIMAVAHREHPVVGVQFHPESAATRARLRAHRALPARRRRARATTCRRGPTAPPAISGVPCGACPTTSATPFVPPPVEQVRYGMILETIVTTVAADGTVNCAPMGVEWGDDRIVLKPFLDTATYRNVLAVRAAVVNLVDDVRVFARAAISNPSYPTVPAPRRCAACGWRTAARGASSRCVAIDSTPPRSRIEAGVVHRGVRREFIGFNRAAHAVLEAAIYATRLHLLPPEFVESELARLQVIVDKTAGPDELEAMALLADVRARDRPCRGRRRA